MGTLYKGLFRRGKVFWLRYTVAGKQVRVSLETEHEGDAVAKALQADGVDPSRLEEIGRGSSLPIASNDTAAGRLQNRRVEIVFSNTAGEFNKQLAGNN